ncbi:MULTISPECIES: DUF6691 family protein [Comamonas]|uniref:DUF6691 family protein n=1 Tax=Comamonas sediminis TaxID=1783360 RepID=A0ABV4AWK9_9BURK|nr:DUF6691 family protein [Comamonas sp. B21-038]ULR90174.1 YeeE/YedE family protein [Comamonas sp. B21-038]
MTIMMAALAGLVFGLGLLVSGMADPQKVLGFLDIAGAWDPSLALVMGGAIALGLPGFALARRRSRSLLGAPMQLPARQTIDAPLLFGSALFGIGWGLAGYCPGPALVGTAAGLGSAAIFSLAMLAGMLLYGLWSNRS